MLSGDYGVLAWNTGSPMQVFDLQKTPGLVGEKQPRRNFDAGCVYCVAVEGSMVCTGNKEGHVLVWDAETGYCILRSDAAVLGCG